VHHYRVRPGIPIQNAASECHKPFAIAKAAQTITSARIPNQIFGDPDFNVSAKATRVSQSSLPTAENLHGHRSRGPSKRRRHLHDHGLAAGDANFNAATGLSGLHSWPARTSPSPDSCLGHGESRPSATEQHNVTSGTASTAVTTFTCAGLPGSKLNFALLPYHRSPRWMCHDDRQNWPPRRSLSADMRHAAWLPFNGMGCWLCGGNTTEKVAALRRAPSM